VLRHLPSWESAQLRAQMAETWQWDGGYWHPLAPVEGLDLLAVDASKFGVFVPESRFRELLRSFGEGDLVLFREHDPDALVTVQELPHVYRWSETILAPHSLSWVVYWSHEDTITFGGATQVAEVKKLVPNWATAVWA